MISPGCLGIEGKLRRPGLKTPTALIERDSVEATPAYMVSTLQIESVSDLTILVTPVMLEYGLALVNNK